MELDSVGPRPSQAGSGNSICLAGRRCGAYFRRNDLPEPVAPSIVCVSRTMLENGQFYVCASPPSSAHSDNSQQCVLLVTIPTSARIPLVCAASREFPMADLSQLLRGQVPPFRLT